MIPRISLSRGNLQNRPFSTTLLRKGPANFVKFNWKDPFDIESLLTEEERSIRDTAHQYCQSKLLPRVIRANREESKRKNNCGVIPMSFCRV